MSTLLIAAATFVAVSTLVGGIALLMRDKPATKIEDRLNIMTGLSSAALAKEKLASQASILSQPLENRPSVLERILGSVRGFDRLFEQADTSMTVAQFMTISGVLAVVGGGAGVIIGVNLTLIPVTALVMAFLPLLWLILRRRRRFKAFAVQLPDALEMLARSLRAGQSLASGLNAVSEEMGPPIGIEFGRVFEEQNLGIPLDESLNSMCQRIPNLDLKFFCTAVVLQRQTGGDLAEILDKIGSLVRQRFAIWGQVQALTGEGRLSGIVLLALPVLLFVVVYQMNPDYISLLLTDPLGKKMLAGAIVLQILGALVIRKIVNIKV
ncbi:MAG TPA: type II secretion system F family protein [Thermoguttaceae bacterium]|nr:type II secretion system F family protein [Thermoguttaceae bacterium]